MPKLGIHTKPPLCANGLGLPYYRKVACDIREHSVGSRERTGVLLQTGRKSLEVAKTCVRVEPFHSDFRQPLGKLVSKHVGILIHRHAYERVYRWQADGSADFVELV